MRNEKNEIDPEVKKAIWKIIVYAVSVLAALFAGNVSAKCGFRFFPQIYQETSNSEYVSQDSFNESICKLQ